MGTSGSKGKKGQKNKKPVGDPDQNHNTGTNTQTDEQDVDHDLTAEPEIEDVDVPVTVPGYPVLKPPANKKADIFNLQKMKHIDKHARETPPEKAISYAELIKHLTAVCTTDLELLRSIFVWLGSQDVRKGDYSDATNSDTPRGFLKLMQKRRARHSSFFPLLCRAAGIPCIIVEGYGKSVSYEVGDEEDKVKTMTNSWNLAYVSGGWRIVFPLWACQAVSGHKSGIYTKVEAKGQAVREKERAAEGETIMQMNEKYFLTDPDVFIYDAFAKNSKHQLLPRPWTLQKFCEVPRIRETYFHENVEITSKFSCRLTTIEGSCNVELTCRDPAGMSMNYELYYNHKESGKDISSDLQLNNFVFLNRSEKKWNFGIRFPEEGVYKLVITGGRGYETELCCFKIYCNDAKENCKPLPFNPGTVGYGPSLDTELAGVKAITHRNGLVRVSAKIQNEFKFTLTKALNLKTMLSHSTIPEEELQQYVKLTNKNRNVNVVVTVPEQGEYALGLYTQEDGQTGYKNVCNYLLNSEEVVRRRKKRNYENAAEKNTRSKLQRASKTMSTKDIGELERAIEKFEKLDMEDKGDLGKAYNALEFKTVKKELDDAVKRRHMEILEKAITRGRESRFSTKLQKEIREAEDVKEHLRNLNRIAHDVLEMNKSTISELCSYKNPPKVVHEVMYVTILMLGERKSNMQDWDDLTCIMRRTGKKSLLRRVRDFDTIYVEPDMRYYANRVIKDYNEAEVCLASAGAGTFYRWLFNVSKALDEQAERSP